MSENILRCGQRTLRGKALNKKEKELLKRFLKQIKKGIKNKWN